MTPAFVPLIVGLGGTTRSGSSSEIALRCALDMAQQLGARTEMLSGAALELPMYAPERREYSARSEHLIGLLRRSHGVIISSPGYHGSISGLIKNALDYVEDMREDEDPYLHGRAIGCVACAHGWQATGSTLAALRSIVHALRGWPTPIGVAINTSQKVFNASGRCIEPSLEKQLLTMVGQVVEFARMRTSQAGRMATDIASTGQLIHSIRPNTVPTE
jgi:FMN reductase